MNHCSVIQSHLLSKHVEKTGSQVHNDKFLRGNLGRKLKTNRGKSTSNTPEKSEIAKMFEKIRLKNEKNRLLSGQKCNQNSSNLKGGQEIDPSENTIDASLVNLSSKLGQSPSLKPKNLSKFNAIRSVFENSDRPVNIENNIGLKEVEKRTLKIPKTSISPDLDSVEKNGDLGGLNLENGRIKSATSLANLGRHNSVKIASNSSVVCAPNPKNISPKRDKNNSLKSSVNEKKMKSKRRNELGQVGTIRKFLESKSEKIEGESKPKSQS